MTTVDQPIGEVVPEVFARAEVLDELDPVLAAAAGALDRAGAGPALRGTAWLGHSLHPLLTDLPIGCWTSAWILDLVGGKSARPAAQRLVALGLLCVPATAASGLVDWNDIDARPTRRIGIAHAACNTAAAVAFFASWRARRRGAHWRGVSWGMVGATAATVAGHLGGHLVFGSTPTEDAAKAAAAATQPSTA